MEYCGGGSIADLMNVTEEPLEESQIAYICREALKVWLTLIGLKMKKYSEEAIRNILNARNCAKFCAGKLTIFCLHEVNALLAFM